MFRKLIKWEIKSQTQFLYLCIAVIVIGIVSSAANAIFQLLGDNAVVSFAALFCKMIVMGSAFALITAWLLMTCTRFRNNLFKDEGYLMHTLPVSAEQLVLSKVLAPLISLFVCLAAIYLEISIYLRDFTTIWDILYKSFVKEFSGLGVIGIATAVLLLLQTIMLLCALYMSVTTGYRFSQNKDIATAAIFILLYILYQFFTIICMTGMLVMRSHSLDFNKVFASIEDSPANLVGMFIILACLIDTLAIWICTGFSIHNVKKHLNLE